MATNSEVFPGAPSNWIVSLPSNFHSLLNSVKSIEKETSYEKLLDVLKEYIMQKQLYDIHNPIAINCKDDELGCVFGVTNFSLYELKNLLFKTVVTVSNLSDINLKRRLAASDDGNAKKNCTNEGISRRPPSPMFLEIPRVVDYDSERDDSESIQGYETAFVQDSSDEFWLFDDERETNANIIAVQEMYNLEFEVESDSSNEVKILSDTDSEVEEVLEAAVLSFACSAHDTDMEFWADQSSEDDYIPFDLEISESDKWECKKCLSLNDPPMRFCLRCWNERRGWLPERMERREPPKRRRRLRNPQKINSEQKESCSPTVFEALKSEIAADASSQSCEGVSSQNSIKSQENDDLTPLCTICLSRKRNASIIHRNIGHQISCFTCARRLYKLKMRCPFCRRKIDKVVQLITP